MAESSLVSRRWRVAVIACYAVAIIGLAVQPAVRAQAASDSDRQRSPASADAIADTERGRSTEQAVPPEFESPVADAQRVGEQLRSTDLAGTVAWSAPARTAMATAERAHMDRCAGARYRAIALNPAADEAVDQTVYLIATEGPGHPMLGRHYRLVIGNGGTQIKSMEPSSSDCLRLVDPGTGPKDFAYVKEILGCTPNEFHTYLSRLIRAPLYVETSVGTWRVHAGRIAFVSPRKWPCAASRLPETENRWIAVRSPSSGGGESYVYSIAFQYFDWDGGFGARYEGRASIDESGTWQWVERQPSAQVITLRLPTFPVAHLLSDPALTQLGLAKVPEWQAYYHVHAEPVAQQVKRGSALNGAGQSHLALKYLLPAQQSRPEAAGLAYELAFAYNAIQRFDAALDVLSGPNVQTRNDFMLCKELGFAQLHMRLYQDAAETLQHCLDLRPEEGGDAKAETAANLALAYRGLGASETCQRWIERAASWATIANRLRQQFEEARNDPSFCRGSQRRPGEAETTVPRRDRLGG